MQNRDIKKRFLMLVCEQKRALLFCNYRKNKIVGGYERCYQKGSTVWGSH